MRLQQGEQHRREDLLKEFFSGSYGLCLATTRYVGQLFKRLFGFSTHTCLFVLRRQRVTIL